MALHPLQLGASGGSYNARRGERVVRCTQPFAPRLVPLLLERRSSASVTHSEQRPVSVLVSILITFLVIVLVLWLVQRLPLEARIRQIAQVIVIIIGIVALLKYLAVF